MSNYPHCPQKILFQVYPQSLNKMSLRTLHRDTSNICRRWLTNDSDIQFDLNRLVFWEGICTESFESTIQQHHWWAMLQLCILSISLKMGWMFLGLSVNWKKKRKKKLVFSTNENEFMSTYHRHSIYIFKFPIDD